METVGTDSQNNKCALSWKDVYDRAAVLAKEILFGYQHREKIYLYGIPRGGIHAAPLVKHELITLGCHVKVIIAQHPSEADVFIDDVIDSGATKDSYAKKFRRTPFLALYDKTKVNMAWLIFPWEAATNEMGPEENIRRVLEYLGEDPNREGLKETPQRVVKSWEKLYSGYRQKPAEILKMFKEDSSDEMVLLKDIEFYSTCEHHMLPFWGRAHIAYVPNGKVVGISKLARLVEIFARRLQIQERLCQQVTASLDEVLEPKGSACILEAQHFCMTSRGVEKQNSVMTTSSLTGLFRNDGVVRMELFNLIKGRSI